MNEEYLATLRNCGFKIPRPDHTHVTLRRNREPLHRYRSRARKVAKLIADRAGGPAFVGMPRISPLVIPPPFRFPATRGAFFLVSVDPHALAREIPPGLEPVPRLEDKVLLAIMKHEGVHGEAESGLLTDFAFTFGDATESSRDDAAE